jgi:hypothetical protein
MINFQNARKKLTIAAEIAALVALILAVIALYFAEPFSLDSKLTKHKVKNRVAYVCKITNDSYWHAKDFAVCGKLNTDKLFLKLNVLDQVTSKNTTDGNIKICLNRLSKGKSLNFAIIASAEANLSKDFVANWGNRGDMKISVSPSDERIDNIIDATIDAVEPARKARKHWLKNNSNW